MTHTQSSAVEQHLWPRALLRRLHQLEDGLLASVLTLMLTLAMADIVLRLIAGGGPIWIQPLLQVLVLWLGLLGALLASRSQEHIAIDVISRFVGPLGKRICGVSGMVFAATVCALVAISSVDFVKSSLEYQDTAFAQLPAWPLQMIIPLSFSLMALRFCLHAWGFLSQQHYQPNPSLRESTLPAGGQH